MPKGPFECPVCGEDVPAKAKACPHCGACEKSGWNEDASAADGLDLPDDNFNYEEFSVRRSLARQPNWRASSFFWKVIAVVLLVLIVAAFVFQQFFFR